MAAGSFDGSRWNLQSLWGILCVASGDSIDRFMSGHGSMTSFSTKLADFYGRFFQRNCIFGHNLLPLIEVETLCVTQVRKWPHRTFEIASWTLRCHPRSLTLADPCLISLNWQTFFEFLKSSSDAPSKCEVSGKNKSCKVSVESINTQCCRIVSKVHVVWRWNLNCFTIRE